MLPSWVYAVLESNSGLCAWWVSTLPTDMPIVYNVTRILPALFVDSAGAVDQWLCCWRLEVAKAWDSAQDSGWQLPSSLTVLCSLGGRSWIPSNLQPNSLGAQDGKASGVWRYSQ